MPRIVSDQRHTYDTNELFRRLSRETEIKYAGYQDRTPEERQVQFQNACRVGRADIAFVSSGTNFSLRFFPWNTDNFQGVSPPKDFVNFDREPGKVFLRAPLILNGVCVVWKGWVNLRRLEGMGSIEYDEERAQIEAAHQSMGYSPGINKIMSLKSSTRKHSGSDGQNSEIDKRPRLH